MEILKISVRSRTLRFLPQLEMRPTSIAPNPEESRAFISKWLLEIPTWTFITDTVIRLKSNSLYFLVLRLGTEEDVNYEF